MIKEIKRGLLALTLGFACAMGMTGCSSEDVDLILDLANEYADEEYTPTDEDHTTTNDSDVLNLEYTGDAWVNIGTGGAVFTAEEIAKGAESFEEYGELDELGRCTFAYASVGTDLMPTDKRESISKVKPSGWQAVKYDCVPGKYLYNRCHLIGFQLTGENANERNLITGTRYLNIDGMLDFEDSIADYVKETGNHVLYRVTPVYNGDELVARGLIMEGYSVEDNGEGINFNVWAYNVQPGITINYLDGTSQES